jgi:hypothetical protein
MKNISSPAILSYSSEANCKLLHFFKDWWTSVKGRTQKLPKEFKIVEPWYWHDHDHSSQFCPKKSPKDYLGLWDVAKTSPVGHVAFFASKRPFFMFLKHMKEGTMPFSNLRSPMTLTIQYLFITLPEAMILAAWLHLLHRCHMLHLHISMTPVYDFNCLRFQLRWQVKITEYLIKSSNKQSINDLLTDLDKTCHVCLIVCFGSWAPHRFWPFSSTTWLMENAGLSIA